MRFQRVANGVDGSACTLGTEVEIGRLIAGGTDCTMALTAADYMPLTQVLLFNPQGGASSILTAG